MDHVILGNRKMYTIRDNSQLRSDGKGGHTFRGQFDLQTERRCVHPARDGFGLRGDRRGEHTTRDHSREGQSEETIGQADATTGWNQNEEAGIGRGDFEIRVDKRGGHTIRDYFDLRHKNPGTQ